jgi:hypothetical protein
MSKSDMLEIRIFEHPSKNKQTKTNKKQNGERRRHGKKERKSFTLFGRDKLHREKK